MSVMNIPQLNIELFAHVFVSTSIVHCILVHYSRILSRMFTTWLNPLIRPRLYVMKNLCSGLDIILIIYVEFLDKYSGSDLLQSFIAYVADGYHCILSIENFI